jgi:hypothetical protein
MAEPDYVNQLLSAQRVAGLGAEMNSEDIAGVEEHIDGLVEVGALTEVGRKRLKHALRAAQGGSLPSPPFAQSSRATERRAPLGFVEDGTGKFFFSLAAAIGASTTMRAKVSRVAHVNRLLIVPSLAGAVINSIKVGDEEQTLASGVPVELYGTTALTDTEPDNFSPIAPGLDFIVELVNTTATAITGTIGTKCACKR